MCFQQTDHLDTKFGINYRFVIHTKAPQMYCCVRLPIASCIFLLHVQATPANHVLQTTPETTPTTSPRRQSTSRAQKASEAVAKAVARSVSTSSLPPSTGSRDESAEASSAAEEEVVEPAPLSAQQVYPRREGSIAKKLEIHDSG